MKIVTTTNLDIPTILSFVLSDSVYSYIVVSARANLLPREGATRKYISIAYALTALVHTPIKLQVRATVEMGVQAHLEFYGNP